VLPDRRKKGDLVSHLQVDWNELQARYLVCGGFAIMQAGYPRFTGDIDLLVEASSANEARVFAALEILHDKAVKELEPGDLGKFGVCRVADEVLVDLMASASGIEYGEVSDQVVVRTIQGVPIPFASPSLLWRMKSRTHREKDQLDLLFFATIIRGGRHDSARLSLGRTRTVSGGAGATS
jgi:hypothetical protein